MGGAVDQRLRRTAACRGRSRSRNKDTGFLVTGQVPGDSAVHTVTDVPLSACGRGAAGFTGLMDNTDVFFKLAKITGAR